MVQLRMSCMDIRIHFAAGSVKQSTAQSVYGISLRF